MDFDVFQRDPKTIKAIQLDLIVIGEASSDIPDEIRTAHPEIPWQIMHSMRNRLVHVYFAVDPQIVWVTVQNDLPPLIGPLEDLLASADR